MFTLMTRLSDTRFGLHAIITGNKVSAGLRAGRIVYDPLTRLLSIGKGLSIDVPQTIDMVCDVPYTFALFDQDGNPKLKNKPDATGTFQQQERGFTLKLHKNGTYYAAGTPKSPAIYGPPEWRTTTYAFRLFYTHEGVTPNPAGLEHLNEIIKQKRLANNKTARLCQMRVRECFIGLEDELAQFREETLAAIDRFNNSLGRSKDKLKYPRGINSAYLSLQPFYKLLLQMKYAKNEGRQIPEELNEMVTKRVAAIRPRVNYEPVNDLQSNFSVLFGRLMEGEDLIPKVKMQSMQQHAITLNNRKKLALPLHKGWVQPRYEDRDNKLNWAIPKHIDAAGVSVHKILKKNGFGGLQLGPRLAADKTGHPEMKWAKDPENASNNGSRSLRQVTIALPVKKGEPEQYVNLVMLQHREFPPEAHLKQWTLCENKGKLSLCLTLLVKQEKPGKDITDLPAAGVDIGWYVDQETGYVRVATVFNPTTKETQFITLDLEGSYGRDKETEVFGPDETAKANETFNKGKRLPFHAKLGKSAWGRSRILFDAKREQPMYPTQLQLTDEIQAMAEAIKAGEIDSAEAKKEILRLLDLSKQYVFVDTLAGVIELQARRSQLTELVKNYTIRELGEAAPPWIARIGAHTLKVLGKREDVKLPEGLEAIITQWASIDHLFSSQNALISAKIASRKEKEYERIANNILRWLSGSAGKIRMEEKFLAQVAGSVTSHSEYSIRHGSRYRQWAAPGRFIETLVKIAPKYGMPTEKIEATNTTVTCHVCGHINEIKKQKRGKRKFRCQNPNGCFTLLEQDENASINIAKGPEKKKLAAKA